MASRPRSKSSDQAPSNQRRASRPRRSGESDPPRPDVGYGRPPKEHQFKPGQSGNPRGRRKGSKNESTILHELLHRKVAINENQRRRKVTVLEAMLMRFAEDSLKGNTKSATFLLNRYGSMVSGEIDQPLNEDEREVLEEFAQRIAGQKGGSR